MTLPDARERARRIVDDVDGATEEQAAAYVAFRVAEASFRLEPSEWTRPGVINAAVHLLAAGLDGPNIATLAGEDHADWRELDRSLDLALQDLGQEPLARTRAFELLLDSTASDLAGGRIASAVAAKQIARGWTAVAFMELRGKARDVAVAAIRWDDLGGRPYGPPPDELLDACRSYVTDVDNRPGLARLG